MPYIARNAANEIIGIHESQLEGHDHWLDAEEAEVKEFLIKHQAKQSLTGSDVDMIRVVEDLIDVLKNSAGDKWKVGSIERFKFYEEAKQAYMIVSTTDARAFGCFIITKGVIKPDGSVW